MLGYSAMHIFQDFFTANLLMHELESIVVDGCVCHYAN